MYPWTALMYFANAPRFHKNSMFVWLICGTLSPGCASSFAHAHHKDTMDIAPNTFFGHMHDNHVLSGLNRIQKDIGHAYFAKTL
eukprot:6312224-Karenia_brevis.AAC.1